jgi:hypothetical protein
VDTVHIEIRMLGICSAHLTDCLEETAVFLNCEILLVLPVQELLGNGDGQYFCYTGAHYTKILLYNTVFIEM